MIRLLVDGEFRDGFHNMALDELLAAEVESGRLGAFVRLYGWRPPAVSLGRNQRAEEVDLEACRRNGVDVVRRPTGGRAVYHRDELTYSLAGPFDHPIFGGSAMDAYRAIARGLGRGLRILGVEAGLTRSAVPAQKAGGSPSCFAASGRYELEVGGRKIAGSAQRRYSRSFLQQGSVLLAQGQNTPHFRNPAPPGSFTTVRAELGRQVEFEEAARAMERGMAEEWGAELSRTLPDPAMEERAGARARETRAAGLEG
ncbi:MAG TPA: octanoyltransferase [candidate division Zixibacteria bacterium]|nr:octanoyltransferase [candidate division Zixibacteria bacterium]